MWRYASWHSCRPSAASWPSSSPPSATAEADRGTVTGTSPAGRSPQPIFAASSTMIPLGRAVAEPIDVSVALHLANELAAMGSQARDDGIDVVDSEREVADALPGCSQARAGRRPGPAGSATSPARAVRGRPGP